MAMNSIAMKLQSYQEDTRTSEYDSSRTHHTESRRSSRRSSRSRKFDPDITEITVSIDHVSALNELSGRFNLDDLRSESFEPVNIDSLVKGYRDPKGRRSAPRHEVQITVVLYTQNSSFRTSTMNISAGGAMLQDQLPKNFNLQMFDILFIYEDKNVSRKRYFMMKGQTVGADSTTNRIQFKGASPSTKESFHKFVEELAA